MDSMTGGLTHFDAAGQARMVDVSGKEATVRVARAGCRVGMKPETLALIASGGHAKGDVLGIARIAGIMAAKRTADLSRCAIHCHSRASSWISAATPSTAGSRSRPRSRSPTAPGWKWRR